METLKPQSTIQIEKVKVDLFVLSNPEPGKPSGIILEMIGDGAVQLAKKFQAYLKPEGQGGIVSTVLDAPAEAPQETWPANKRQLHIGMMSNTKYVTAHMNEQPSKSSKNNLMDMTAMVRETLEEYADPAKRKIQPKQPMAFAPPAPSKSYGHEMLWSL